MDPHDRKPLEEVVHCYNWIHLSSIGSIGRTIYQKKMAKEDVQKCLEWLLNTQSELETDPFGICKAAILEASIRQQNRSTELLRYQDNIKRS